MEPVLAPAPPAPPRSVRVAVALLGVITAVPIVSLLGEPALAALYGLPALDPATELLLGHRGVLQAVLGIALVAAAVRAEWLVQVAVAAIVTKGSFVALVLADPDARERIGLVSVVFDVVAIAVLAGVAARRRPAA